MKKLFICETPYQIIVSLYIKEQYTNNNDCVDIVITNHFSGHLDIIKNLKKLNLFNNVYFAEIKNNSMNKFKRLLKKARYILHPQKMMNGVFGEDIPCYSEIYYWNSDFFTQTIRSYYALHKKNVKAFLFEEGYDSYLPYKDICNKGWDITLIKFRNQLCRKKQINVYNIDGLLLFDPELLSYKPLCNVYKIDRKIGYNSKFKDNIVKIFNAEKVAAKYDKKYIIFEEAEYSNSNEEDEKVFDDIIEKVGKENVIVKLHPRTRNDRFSKKGIKTLGNDGVPWEALSFAKDFSKNVLITISSGSVLNYKRFFGNNMTGFMLFKMIKIKTPNNNEKYGDYWDKIEDNTLMGLHIPKTKDEFNRLLDLTKQN